MVKVELPDGGSFCIDSTELRRGDYDAFVAAAPPLDALQPASCAWNTQLWGSFEYPFTEPEDAPVIYVNWCQAFAYCAWAGKRLCGKIGGGSLTLDEAFDPLQSQWMYACTRGGSRVFPYGQSFELGACATLEVSQSFQWPAAVGSFPRCEGGFAGIFDMSGNVSEWEDSGDVSEVGPGARAVAHGADFGIFSIHTNCATLAVAVDGRGLNDGLLGFRCCKD